MIGSTTTEFLWLENEGELTGWTQHSISDGGADVHFRNAQLGSYDVFIVGEFFAESLTVYYVAGNDWASPDANVQRIVIDTPGQIFDVYVDDFNRDGRYEVLATVYDGDEGHVYIYDIPADFLNDPWERRSIADEFFANFILLGQSMTPGSPKPFYPSEEYEEQTTPDGRQVKPWISLSGDDDGKHYILVPVSEDADDWTYEKNILVDTGATTSGKIAIADLDGDGYTELIAAGYSIGKLYVFTYAP
ncbi:unnamed protein product [Darwinula stevensoni]|uniref:VCBS repeat-containing protein n=1 Tax=Darwinula stevensoni TaxID=69355 RepID=A0A7R8X7E6_9CRUS|nr:unnamed protein product [Darwinula stevensoni]CAG0882230.1 unnamed protein product [Darwinula stevensoni]